MIFFDFGGKTRLSGKMKFLVLAEKFIFSGGKMKIPGFGGKTRFCNFGGKRVFAVFAVFAVFVENAFLGFWR